MALGTPGSTCQLLSGPAIGYLTRRQGQPQGKFVGSVASSQMCRWCLFFAEWAALLFLSQGKGLVPSQAFSAEPGTWRESLVSKSLGSPISQMQEQLGQILQIGNSV